METYEDHAASMVLDCSAYMAVGDLKYFDTIYYWLEVLNGNQETPTAGNWRAANVTERIS